MARRFVREVVDGQLSPDEVQDALLATSELVTNAVRHAGSHGSIRLFAEVDERGLAVVVRDDGSGFDPAARRRIPGEGGFGLDLVEAVATNWGVVAEPGATEAWFEIDAM